MEKTPKYEFGKPDQNDFYDVDVFNNNMEKVETAMTEFDDTGTVAEIKSFPEMLTKLVTGNKLAVTLRNLKAGLQFVLHVFRWMCDALDLITLIRSFDFDVFHFVSSLKCIFMYNKRPRRA